MKRIVILFISILYSFILNAQTDIHALMERRDLKLEEIKTMADMYFEKYGTGKGSGHKQFQRWYYEQQFHLDANGYIKAPQQEFDVFSQAVSGMTSVASGIGPFALSGIWSEMGPTGWNKTSGWNPGTGRLVSMDIHPLNENIIYVGSPGGGLWKSTNSGTTWTPLSEYNTVWMHIYSLAIDPLNQNIVYAGTGNSGNQVIRSTDAGLTWSLLGSGPTGNIRKILIHPTSTNIIFACANNGIFRSTNSGTSWTQVQNVTKEDIEFKPGNPGVMYASGTTQVVKSVDGGVTWSVLGTTEGISNTGRTLISVTPANPDVVYVVQASGSLFGRLYRSANSGVSFTTMITGNPTSGTNFFGYETDGTGTTGQATYDMGMCVSPTDANEVHIAGIICWKSTDGGLTFSPSTAWSLPNSVGYNHADVHGLEFVNSNIYSISDGGIYKSINHAGDWTDLSGGLGIRQFYRIASAPTNANVVTGGAQDNGSVAKQSTGTWVDWLGADGMEGLVSPTNHLNLWGTSQYGHLYKSTNGGNSYTNLATITGGAWVTPLAIHPTDQTIIFAGGTAMYKSTNGGTSFTSISGTTITNSLVDIAVAPGNANYIYGCYNTSLYMTSNGGTSWNTYTAPGNITDICVSPNDPLKLWITTSSGTGSVFVSLNGGASFTNITGALPSIAARTIVVDNSTDEKLYVGMNIGVYTYSNILPSWTVMTDNLPLVAINELDIHYASNKLRVATYGRGVWETSLNSTGCNAPSNLLSGSITLTSATLSWASVSGAVSYTLEYKLSTASTWTVLLPATTLLTYNLTGLTQGTSYDFRVKTNCSALSSYYAQAQFTTLAPTPLCINSYEPNETQATSISIPVNTVLSSGINSATDIDFYSVTTTTYVDFNITLTNLPYDYDLELRNAAGTVIGSSTAGGTNDESILLATQPPGTYFIRVFGYAGAFSLTQCYNLLVGTTIVSYCVPPGGLSTTSIGGTTATFNWTVVGGALSYQVQYRSIGSASWLNAGIVTTNTINVTGLSYNTNYEWQVKTICSPDSSLYSSSSLFTTLPNCPLTAGSTMALPIVVGQAPCVLNAYTNTQTNSTANCFLNNFTGTLNQASPNIWYQFTLSSPTTVQVSHCGSGLTDTYIHLLNSSGTTLFSNDDNGPLCSGYHASITAPLTAGTYYVVSEGYGSNVGSITTTIKTIDACNTTLNLTLFIESYYIGGGLMAPVLLNEGYNVAPLPTLNDVDDMIVQLRDASVPATILAADTVRLQINGTASCVFPAVNASCYIMVLHRNTLETWSKLPMTFGAGNYSYDFSNAATKAYGDNMKQIGAGLWAFYSGEIVKDENIDLLDLSLVQNDIAIFQSGYYATDLNGDGNIDLLDTPNIEQNVNDFIFSIHP